MRTAVRKMSFTCGMASSSNCSAWVRPAVLVRSVCQDIASEAAIRPCNTIVPVIYSRLLKFFGGQPFRLQPALQPAWAPRRSPAAQERLAPPRLPHRHREAGFAQHDLRPGAVHLHLDGVLHVGRHDHFALLASLDLERVEGIDVALRIDHAPGWGG